MVQFRPFLPPQPQAAPLPQPPRLPPPQADSPFAALLQGASRGLQIGTAIKNQKLKDKQLALQQRQTNLTAFKTLSDIAKTEDKAVREFLLKQGAGLIGMDPKSDTAKNFIAMMNKADENTRKVMAQAMADAGVKGMTLDTFKKIMANPAAAVNFFKMQKGKEQQEPADVRSAKFATGGNIGAARELIRQKMLKPQVSVAEGEKEESKKLAEIRTKAFEERGNEARAAKKALANLAQLKPLLEKAGAGPGASETVRLKRLFAGLSRGLGFETTAKSIEGEQVGAKEAADAVANRLTLALKNTFNLGVRGFDTPAEREFVQALSPGITTSPQGRKLLFQLVEKTYRRQIAIDRESRKYIQSHGTLVGVEDHLDKLFSQKPVFSKGDMAPLAVLQRKQEQTRQKQVRRAEDILKGLFP